MCSLETINFKTDNLIRKELTMDHPYNNWEKYQAEKVVYLEQKYRKIAWYEKEEPISRVLRRLKRQFDIKENEFLEIIKKLK